MNNKIFLLPLTAFLLTACGEEKAALPSEDFKTVVSLDEASSADGCLSLPNYFQSVRAMDPGRPVQEVTKNIDVESKHAIRANFRLLLVYGSAHAAVKPLGEISDFQEVSQEACSKLTVTSPDGAAESYDIISSTKESLKAENDDGLGFEFTWLSPTRMRITQRYLAYDLPCGTDTAITVTHTKELDWSGEAADAVAMDSGLVKNIADTVGADPAEVSDGNGKISLARLQELLSRDPRPELLTCSGQPAPIPGPAPIPAPTPTPTPQPTPQPTPDNPNPGEEGPAPGPVIPAPNPGDNPNNDSPWWWPWP